MATTFKVFVDPASLRRDGTRNVKIRVTHGRRTLKVPTHLYATADDLTRSFELKNYDYIDQTDDIIRRWRGHVAKLGEASEGMTVQQIVARIKDADRNRGRGFQLDFIEYSRKVVARKSAGTARVYKVAVDALERFAEGKPLDVSRITATFCEQFETYIRGLSKSGNARAAELYLSCLRNIHNSAKYEFNDEDLGVMNIPGSPFKKYTIKKAAVLKRKRTVSPETIQAVIDLPDGDPLRDLARDTFLLSFALAGMNAADLYGCPAQRLDAAAPVIVYHRQKTRTRRAEGGNAYSHRALRPLDRG